jgi:hypothetical protein
MIWHFLALMGIAMLIVLLVAAVYFLPTLIALLRRQPELRLIFLTNLFLGWSPIDWAAAFGKACASREVSQR